MWTRRKIENASIVQPSAADQYGNTQITEGRVAIGGDYSYTVDLGSLQTTGATFHVNRVVYWMQSEYDNATKIGGTWYANSTLYLIDASGYEIENQPISMTGQSNIIGYTDSNGSITYQAAWGGYYTMFGPAGAGMEGTAQAGYSNIQASASNTLMIP